MKITTIPLAIETLKEFGDKVGEAIAYAQTFYLEYPNSPKKPKLEDKHNSRQIAVYQKAYEQYEYELVNYGKEKMLFSERQNDINSMIEDYIKDITGFNDLPEKNKSKVWHKAWEDGHSDGYHQVYYELVELIDLFN